MYGQLRPFTAKYARTLSFLVLSKANTVAKNPLPKKRHARRRRSRIRRAICMYPVYRENGQHKGRRTDQFPGEPSPRPSRTLYPNSHMKSCHPPGPLVCIRADIKGVRGAGEAVTLSRSCTQTRWARMWWDASLGEIDACAWAGATGEV